MAEIAYRAGGFMAHRLVCWDCAEIILRRIKMGLSEAVPWPTGDIPAGATCTDCRDVLTD